MHRLATTIVLIGILSLWIEMTLAAAGRCYQCNSRNPLCATIANATLKIDSTPCNGQCYTRLNTNDEFTLSRGCSWEFGFMTPQETDTLVLDGRSVWMFCDTPYCNVEATSMLTTVCYQPICNYLNFPEDCKLPNADVTCGRYCNNKLCNTTLVRRATRNRNRNRNRRPIKLNL
ncbi:unnamed protein product [Adineta ricciae]|uniref:Uncharacterized protein n=1 Tax=Adineta ricciae TaxID=249248 RepID=A0A815P196_ADIRI|nr:unnamed protein product [Adineta ricciae]